MMYRDVRSPSDRIRRLDDFQSRHPIAQPLKLDSKYSPRLLIKKILFSLRKQFFSSK